MATTKELDPVEVAKAIEELDAVEAMLRTLLASLLKLPNDPEETISNAA